ncbi:MAG TPA: hypothetical protein VJL87_05310 [Bdellovibrionota bacterium]|nr:hypothetical protein [Bdellovibrionota bacterium]
MTFLSAPAGSYGLYAQQGINLLQVGALRLPCLMASIASVVRVAEIALRGVSKALDCIGFNGQSTFAKWITAGVNHVRPYKDEEKYSMRKLLLEAVALSAIGVLGNTFVSALFGPPPAIYNTVLQWIGPIRVSTDMHPLIQLLAQRFYS